MGAWACAGVVRAKETAQTNRVDVFIPKLSLETGIEAV
jgi:hypothetical protein